MRRTTTLSTVLTVASTYVGYSAGSSAFRTGGQVQEPRPTMELSDIASKNPLVVLADADLNDLLDEELDEHLLPIPREATSPRYNRGNKKTKSCDASNSRYLQENYGKDDHQSSTGSPTSFPSIVHDIREDDYAVVLAALPSLAPLSPTTTFPTASTPTASPTLAPSSPTRTFSTASTPTASPTLAPSSPTTTFPTASSPTALLTLTPSSPILFPTASTPTATPTLTPSPSSARDYSWTV